MNFHTPVSRKIIAIIVGIFLLVALGLALYMLQQQQNLRQEAAGEPDLVITGFQLTDSGGNVRTRFNTGEEIYIRIRLENKGGATGVSIDGGTDTQIYSNSPNPVSANTPSNVNVSMRNGEFGAGTQYVYNSIYGGDREAAFNKNRSWRAGAIGNFTARAYINYDGGVAESNLANNQATIQYTVTGNPQYFSGTVGTSAPSGFTNYACDNRTVSGITGCVVTGPVNGNALVRLTNNTSSTRKVGAAAYKAYYDYPNPEASCSPAQCVRQYDWIWTQTLYSAQTIDLAPGTTRYIRIPVPACNWQVDAFLGDIILSFKPPNQYYTGFGTYIDGWLEQYNGIQECKPDEEPFPSPTPTISSTPSPTKTLTPSPSPTITPSVSPTNTPTGTLTPTLTPTNTPTLTPTLTPTATPTVTVCPVPEEVLNVRIECPFCDL